MRFRLFLRFFIKRDEEWCDGDMIGIPYDVNRPATNYELQGDLMLMGILLMMC